MPALAVGARRILVGVDLHQRGSPGSCGAAGMDVQLAEQPAEGQMLLRRDVLVAEEDDEVFGQRPVDFVELPVGERLARDRRR